MKGKNISKDLIQSENDLWKREQESSLIEFTVEELRPSVQSTCWFQQYFLGRGK